MDLNGGLNGSIIGLNGEFSAAMFDDQRVLLEKNVATELIATEFWNSGLLEYVYIYIFMYIYIVHYIPIYLYLDPQ